MGYRKTPQPEIVTCETAYGAAYAWCIKSHGLMVLGDTRLECATNFLTAYESEYNKPFSAGLSK